MAPLTRPGIVRAGSRLTMWHTWVPTERFRFTSTMFATQDDPAADGARRNDEAERSSAVRGHQRDLHLRQYFYYPQHVADRRDSRRCLLDLPPVLHRQAEDPGHRWPG